MSREGENGGGKQPIAQTQTIEATQLVVEHRASTISGASLDPGNVNQPPISADTGVPAQADIVPPQADTVPPLAGTVPPQADSVPPLTDTVPPADSSEESAGSTPGKPAASRKVRPDPHSQIQQARQRDPVSVTTFQATIVVLVWIFIGLFVTVANDESRHFLKDHYPQVALGLVVLLVITLTVDLVRWAKRATARARAGFTIFFSVPLILVLLGTLFLWRPPIQVLVIRTVFLLSACLLPASMYFLFIATKKYSLVNEFLTNLGKLGLPTAPAFEPQGAPAGQAVSDDAKRQRVETYLQRFEAAYGPIPPDYVTQMFQGPDSGQFIGARAQSTTPVTELFTAETALPVIQATVLVVLGWLITLPPWQGTFLNEVQGTIAKTRPEIGKTPQTSSSSGETPLQRPQAQMPLDAQANQDGNESAAQPESTPQDPLGDWAKQWLAAITPVETPVYFGFIGAYFFSLQMLFRRYVRRDLRASAYVNVSLRIILAVIGTWIVVAAAKTLRTSTTNTQLLVVGFAVGVFPRVAWQAVRAATNKVLGNWFKLPSFETQLPISDLDGLTVWHEARLEEEDIENVPNMANADLVDLMLNTRFPPDRIIDWMDQAILYTHLGPENQNGGNAQEDTEARRRSLRSHGIYTASALIRAHKSSEARQQEAEFEKILGADGDHPVRSIIDAIGTNPNMKLILKWRGLET